MCLGALFIPDDGPANSHVEAIKAKYRQLAPGHSFSDVKYSRSGDKFTSELCKEIIDLFISQPGWFRCLVIDTSLRGFSWGEFGGRGAPRGLAKARSYSRLAELLLENNLQGVENAVLLADSLTEAPGDDFVQHISQRFGTPLMVTGPVQPLPRIKYVRRVNTGLPDYQLGQVCDVLLGIVTGDLVHPTNRNKLALIQHAKESLGVPSFSPEYWIGLPGGQSGELNLKFHVRHWRPK